MTDHYTSSKTGSGHWREVYNANARLYKAFAAGFHLFGIARQRRCMMDALKLQSGDTVVDLCCGSGQNFADLEDRVGRNGRIVGVDISGNMLALARERVEKQGWRNVELVEADVESFRLPPDTAAVISTFGLDIVPDVDPVVEDIAAQMPDGARLGLLGSKEPAGWPDWLVEFGMCLNRPFDIERHHLAIRPDLAAAASLDETDRRSFWAGIFYWSVAVKPADRRAA
ncbi:MAG: class I SAM-dependent methyltransferase [Pacificimonas sp.]